MKKILIFALVLMLCSTAFAKKIHTASSDKLGAFSGDGGAAQDDSAKASMDLAHTDLDAMITYDSDVLGFLGQSTGGVWYVDASATGTAAGTSWTNAEVTIEGAIADCTADAGDIILVAPGHAETKAASGNLFDADKAGITIIGLGTGELRPTLTINHADANTAIGADDVTIKNIRFFCTITAVVSAITVEAGCENFVIEDCVFDVETPGTDEFVDTIIVAGTGSDGGLVKNCLFDMGATSNAGPQSAINFIDCDYFQIISNRFFGDQAVACIQNETTASNFVVIKDNLLFNGIIGGDAGLNAQPCIELVSTTTGLVVGNTLACNVATPELAIVGADMYLAGNTYSEMEGTAGSRPIGLQGRFGQVNICRATTSAMTSGNGYDATDDPNIFTVTGDILCRAAATFSTQITSTSSDTLELGVLGNTAILLVQDVADGTAFDVGFTWTKETAADADGGLMDIEWVLVSGGTINLTINDHTLTAGVANFYLEWIALSGDAEVVAAAP